jgi:hypothetical protein
VQLTYFTGSEALSGEQATSKKKVPSHRQSIQAVPRPVSSAAPHPHPEKRNNTDYPHTHVVTACAAAGTAKQTATVHSLSSCKDKLRMETELSHWICHQIGSILKLEALNGIKL